MKILIDARMCGLEHGGIGRYVENLINHLLEIDSGNSYIMLTRAQNAKLKSQNHNLKVETIFTDIQHYSFQEQVELPRILNRLDFDIAHFPHFNVPLSFNRPYVVTIHDLIKHTSTGMKTTTRNPILYWAKYLGYKKVFSHAVKASRKIIVPSHVVKADLLINYDIPDDKVVVIYEGVDSVFSEAPSIKYMVLSSKYKIRKPYIIYTGSVYPHKNVERLIQATCKLELNLVIVGSRNVFLDRVVEYVKRHHAENQVNFLGFVPDEDLVVLYKNAKAFVFPSLSEGFGLPGIEAMTAGCPVVCSDIPVFHEIYENAAVYFNPENVDNIARKIGEVINDPKTGSDLVKRGKMHAKQFSWKKMAEETLKVYEAVL